MEILIDTNVFIDMFQKRQPFTDFATAVITSCVNGQNTGFVSSHSLSDMFYILRKDFSATERKELIRFICTYFTVICEQKEDFLAAVDNSLSLDMEDVLQMQCAKKHMIFWKCMGIGQISGAEASAIKIYSIYRGFNVERFGS